MDALLFYVFAFLAVLNAVIVVAQRNPIYSAFALIGVFCSLSAIYGLLGSPFIATLQIVVYAGAIMVLFLFVLMLLNVKQEEHAQTSGLRLKGAGLALCAVLVLQAGSVILRSGIGEGGAATFDASSRTMAKVLFSPYFLYAFEATSILILSAIVGAVALAKKEL
jgi:NADH-quinone oxidoreductase subunit J